MVRSQFTSAVAAFAATMALGAGSAFASTVVAGNSAAFAPGSGSWAWDGLQHDELRGALEDTGNFGAGGVVAGPAIDAIDLADITSVTLGGVDVFVSSYWAESESASYEDAILDYFYAGGNLLLLQDASDRDGISTRLGFETNAGSTQTNLVTGDLALGPFGTVFDVTQRGAYGHFDAAVIGALGGSVYGANGLGQATIVGFAPGTLGAGTGAVIAMSDVDMISGSYGGADFDPLNNKGILALNAFANLLEGDDIAVMPLPAGLPMLLAGLGALVFLGRRKSSAG